MTAWQRNNDQAPFIIAKYPMRTDKYPISHEEWEANGDFIVTAANSYHAHLSLIVELQNRIVSLISAYEYHCPEAAKESKSIQYAEEALTRSRAAIGETK